MKIGIISDIHEDIEGLEKAFEILNEKGCQEYLCLGDIAGYSQPHYKYEKTRDAAKCLKLIRQKCSTIIPGNHDLYACRKIPISDPGFTYPQDWYDMDFSSRERLGKGKIWLYEDTELASNLSDSDMEYISGLPEFVVRDFGGRTTLISHFLFPDLSGSSMRLLPDYELFKSHSEFMDDNNCELSFFGHSHVEGILILVDGNQYLKKKVDLNKINRTISIGFPCIARGTNQPGVSIFDSKAGTIKSITLYSNVRKWFTLK